MNAIVWLALYTVKSLHYLSGQITERVGRICSIDFFCDHTYPDVPPTRIYGALPCFIVRSCTADLENKFVTDRLPMFALNFVSLALIHADVYDRAIIMGQKSRLV
jgi:hypothetical protein